MSANDYERWERTVHAPKHSVDSPSGLGVFCGIHGTDWLDGAIANLERQDGPPVHAVYVVNGISPSAVERLLEWQRQSRHEVWVIENAVNLGPMGSFQRNRDLLGRDWVAILHQDDEYLANHLTTLERQIKQCADDVVGVFAGMDAITVSGARTIPALSEPAQRLSLAPATITVPAIVRQHPFPTPASALKLALIPSDLAWYDSGAPDSELFARMACVGRMSVAHEVTVHYRQPATSQSSTTGWASRAAMWAASLGRLIFSEEFSLFLESVPEAERMEFARSFLLAVPARYPDSSAFAFLQILAAQRMLEAWGYKDALLLTFLNETFSELGPSAAGRNIQPLTSDLDGHGRLYLPINRNALAQVVGHEPATVSLSRRLSAVDKRFGHRVSPIWRSRAIQFIHWARGGRSS